MALIKVVLYVMLIEFALKLEFIKVSYQNMVFVRKNSSTYSVRPMQRVFEQ